MLDNQTTIQAFIQDTATQACEALFADYGVNLQRFVPAAPSVKGTSFDAFGVIGFSGRVVRGTMVLAITAAPLSKSNPLAGAGNARDWLAELTNQLLGRIKIQLLRHQVEIYMRLPAVLGGEHLARVPAEALNPPRFTAENGVVGVWVEIDAESGVHVLETPTVRDTGLATGETIFF